MATEHADTLWAAREQMVTSRRSLAEALTKPYKGGETEGLRSRFVEIQGLIEAIDRAIVDEEEGSEPST